MELRNICDDFFSVGKIAVLQKKTNNDKYDFDFRTYFDCKSIISEVDIPILLHIGAVDNYAEVEELVESMGMKLLVNEAEHIRCSTIDKWYSAIKEKTPFTKVYDQFPELDEILKDFSFPIFVKGNRQTNRHSKTCIVENQEDYDWLKSNWYKDNILSWQKVAIREYVKLQRVDEVSLPGMLPMSYEFRFFCFEGSCMGYGPYWYMADYSLLSEDEDEAIELAEWAAQRVGAEFVTVDLAKTEAGNWIVIEVNDAQESGFVGLNPIPLWKNIIEASQDRNWLPIEDVLDEGTVIMWSDPLPNVSIEDMRTVVNSILTEYELAEAYAMTSNKAWWVDDDVYDYEVGSDEYLKACTIADDWFEISDCLREKIFLILQSEGVEIPPKGYISILVPFMKRNGYTEGRGWWLKDK